RWLPLAASGDGLFCIGITEPDAGSAANLMRSHLTDDGNGGYRLNAYKNYVTGGHKAAACLVWTRFPGGEGAKGIGAVVVDLTASGVSVAGVHKKMGLRGCTEAELAFDDVRIEADDVLIAGDLARPGDGHGQGGRQPGRQVRLRRGHPAPRRLRLQPGVPRRAGLPRYPRPLHRRRHRRGAAQLRRYQPPPRPHPRRRRLAQSTDLISPSLASLRSGELVVLRATG